MTETAIETTYDLASMPGLDIIECFNNKISDIDLILEHVASKLSVSILQMKDKTRQRHIVEARQIAIYLIKEKFGTSYSLKSIGAIFGGRDHSTVIHAIQTVNDLCEQNKAFKEKFNKIYFSL